MTEHQPPLRIDEVAARLGVNHTTVRRAIKNGELRTNRIGHVYLIPASEVERFLRIDDTAA